VRGSHEAGFTLVEVLCALAISCVALVYLMQSLGGSQRAARQLEDQLDATIVARSILLQERQSPVTAPRAGEEGGYRWEVSVAPVNASLSTVVPAGWALHRVIVRVYWGRGGVLELETVKLGK
jgi:type II secretion system protein I